MGEISTVLSRVNFLLLEKNKKNRRLCNQRKNKTLNCQDGCAEMFLSSYYYCHLIALAVIKLEIIEVR